MAGLLAQVELSNLRASITDGNIARLTAALAAATAWMNTNSHKHQIYETVNQVGCLPQPDGLMI